MASLSEEIMVNYKGRSYLPSRRFVRPYDLVGVEVELEQASELLRLINGDIKNYWEVEEDGSLRDNGVEFKTKGPLFGCDLEHALFLLDWNCQRANPVTSYRTSVHIHINVRDMNVKSIFKMFLTYLIFERPIFRMFPKREENLYCVPWFDADDDIEHLRVFLKYIRYSDNRYLEGKEFPIPKEYLAEMLTNGLSNLNKYSAVNLNPITKFGTIEFRHMNGTYDGDAIIRWINVIQCLKTFALDDRYSWNELPQLMSEFSPLQFADDVFGGCPPFNFNYNGLVYDMYQGARLVDYIYRLENA